LCLYFTKLAPISKIADNVPRAERVVTLTQIIRSDNAILPPPLRSGGHPEENTPRSLFFGGGVFKKESRVFFSGCALSGEVSLKVTLFQ